MVSELNCIGCQGCVDVCPQKAISFNYNIWGEGRASVMQDKCVNCNLCDSICPALKKDLNEEVSSVMAVISKKNAKTGSSGGVFYELAESFIKDGGVVYGACFNNKLKLVHSKARIVEEIPALCKSKYLHSDMTGIYNEIKNDLMKGKSVMFVGTPCQTSAVKNLFYNKYKDNVFLVDFLCHGAGTQKVFDICIKDIESRTNGKVEDFNFRSKSRKAEHSFSYFLQTEKKRKKISGYSFEFPYYYSYLKYTIFDDACYACPYACSQRVGDITLGDFWGIQTYNKKLKDYKGVSMVSLNSSKGSELFSKILGDCVVFNYPISCATAKNQSFSEPVKYPKQKGELVSTLTNEGEKMLVEKLACKNIKKHKIYARIPSFVKTLYKLARGGK